MADIGITTASQFPLRSEQQAPRQLLRLPDAPTGINLKRASTSIAGLVKSTVKAIMTQIAYLETNNTLSYNQNSRYGRYALHKSTLINYGYLTADGRSWTGLEGIKDSSDLLASSNLQDRIMEQFLKDQYSTCVKLNAIQSGDSVSTVAGMLAVAYQFQDYIYGSKTPAPNVAVTIDNIQYFALNNAVTVSTTTAHNLLNEQQFSITTASNIELNGTFTVDKVIDTLNLEYINETTSNANVTYSSDGGSIQNPNPVDNIDSSYITSIAGNLVTYLGNILIYQGSSNVASRYYTESGLVDLVQTLKNDNAVSSSTDLNSKRLYTLVEDLNSSSVTTTKLVETALFANIQGQAKQRAISSASASITGLNNKVKSIYNNLPALRAKEWRQQGAVNDSLGRPGALFFNAGRYAVDTLGADVSV